MRRGQPCPMALTEAQEKAAKAAISPRMHLSRLLGYSRGGTPGWPKTSPGPFAPYESVQSVLARLPGGVSLKHVIFLGVLLLGLVNLLSAARQYVSISAKSAGGRHSHRRGLLDPYRLALFPYKLESTAGTMVREEGNAVIGTLRTEDRRRQDGDTEGQVPNALESWPSESARTEAHHNSSVHRRTNGKKKKRGKKGRRKAGTKGGLKCSASPSHCCDQKLRRRLRRHLHNIVLIININYPWVARRTAGFWRRLYSPFFSRIVVISSEDIPDLGIEARGPMPLCKDWRMQYFGLPKIMSRYWDADGFLWTNDDVIINYWKLLQADKTKVWLPNDPRGWETRHYSFNETAGFEFNDDNTLPYYRRVAKKGFQLMNEEHKRKYNESAKPHEDCFQKRVCDLFYIPRRLVEPFAFDVLPAFREARVNSEVAIPSMLYAVEHPTNFDRVLDDMIYRWNHNHRREEVRNSYDPSRYWKPTISALHPWKISNTTMRAKLVQTLRKGDPCVCQDFPELCERDLQ